MQTPDLIHASDRIHFRKGKQQMESSLGFFRVYLGDDLTTPTDFCSRVGEIHSLLRERELGSVEHVERYQPPSLTNVRQPILIRVTDLNRTQEVQSLLSPFGIVLLTDLNSSPKPKATRANARKKTKIN